MSACLVAMAAVLTAWQPPLTDVVAAAVPAHSTHGRLGPVHPWSNRNHKRVSRITAGDPAQFGSPTTLSTICCMNGYDTVAPQEFTVADVNRDGNTSSCDVGGCWGNQGENTNGATVPAEVNSGHYNDGPVVNAQLGNKIGIAICGASADAIVAVAVGGILATLVTAVDVANDYREFTSW